MQRIRDVKRLTKFSQYSRNYTELLYYQNLLWSILAKPRYTNALSRYSYQNDQRTIGQLIILFAIHHNAAKSTSAPSRAAFFIFSVFSHFTGAGQKIHIPLPRGPAGTAGNMPKTHNICTPKNQSYFYDKISLIYVDI